MQKGTMCRNNPYELVLREKVDNDIEKKNENEEGVNQRRNLMIMKIYMNN